MRQIFIALAAAAAMLALTGGCASSGSATSPANTDTPAEQQALARYSAYAGAPIPSFTWFGRFYSFDVLDRNHVVVFTTPFDAYLLKVSPQGPCNFRFVINAIAVTSTASTVYAGTDSLTINSSGTGPGRWLCPIDEIRKVDYQRMTADRRAQQIKSGRANPSPPPSPAAPPGAPAPQAPAGQQPQSPQ
jgi:Family of unknown function (DUF6491)